MKVKYFTIRNFRGIDKLENLEISNLNTFVGKNDAGKSAILRALACFFDVKKFDTKDVFKGKQDDDITSIEISFEPSIEIDDLALDSKKLITIKKEFVVVNGRAKSNEYYLSNDYTDEKYQNFWNKKEQDLNQIISDLGEEPNKSGRGKKNIIRIEQIKELLKENDRAENYHELGDFLKNIEKTYEISLPEYSLFDAEEDLDVEATNFQSRFKPIISNYFNNEKEKTSEIEKEVENNLASEFEEIRKYMIKNVSGLKKLNPKTNFSWEKVVKFDLNLELEGQNFDVPISHKGTGFKRLLMVAYFEYLANKKSIKNQIFAIEEPETYLHPSAQLDLLNSIIKISEDSQFFLTTHSPVFAGATDGKNSILVTKDKSGISHYSKEEQSIIDQIIDELGIRPDYNLLKENKYLIFVEGVDDIHFLKSYAKTVLNKNLEDDKILCVIGGGSSLKNYADLDLFKKLKNGTNLYAVFLDGDNGDDCKQKEKEQIENKCNKDNALFKKLSKKEIENYCHPETIKNCIIESIKNKEGAETQSPIISKINEITINIDVDTDVEKHLKEKEICINFKNGLNVEVFNKMTKEDWEQTDSNNEIKDFIEEIYAQIQ